MGAHRFSGWDSHGSLEARRCPPGGRRLFPAAAAALLGLLVASARGETYADFTKVKRWTASFRIQVRENGSMKMVGISQVGTQEYETSGRVLLQVLDIDEDQALWEGQDGRGQGSGRTRTDTSSPSGSGGERSQYSGSSRCVARLQVDALDGEHYDFGASCGEDEVPGSWEQWGPESRDSGERGEYLLGASSETLPLPSKGLTLEGTRTIRTGDEGPHPGIEGAHERVETHTWRLVPGEVEEVELVFEPVADFYPRWLPEGNLDSPAVSGNALDFRARVQKVGGGVPTRKVARIEFALEETSHELGLCLNFPAGAAADEHPDLALSPSNGNGPVLDWAQTFPVTDEPEAIITVRSFDFGAWGILRVTATMVDGEEVVGRFLPTGGTGATIPADRDGNHMADVWEAAKEASSSPGADDDPEPKGQASAGDGLPNFEEYRGFVIRDPRGRRLHQRTEPRLETLLVIDPEGFLHAEDWRTATGMECYRIDAELAGEGDASLPAKGNASNPNRGFARRPSWDYAVRILRQPEPRDDSYGYAFPPAGWSTERMILEMEPKQVRYVGMWPDKIARTTRFMRENLERALSPDAPTGSAERVAIILAIRAFLSTPERQRLAREALDRLADPAARAALEAAVSRRVAVHEVGHACGVDHHGVSVVDGEVLVMETESQGPESCPMRYNLEEISDRVVIPIVEMLMPSGGMAAGGGRFCTDFPGCWQSLDVNDD